MKIVVIGGTGLIGSKVVTKLTEDGHQAVPATPGLGINTITREGLAEALDGASAVVNVSNSADFEYLTASSSSRPRPHLLSRKPPRGRHPVALSVVGTRRVPPRPGTSPPPPVLPREACRRGPDPDVWIPYSIVHATQFFDSSEHHDVATDGDTVRLPPVRFQPIAAADVAIRRHRHQRAGQRIVEVDGPETFQFDEAVRHALAARIDPGQ